MTTATVAVFAGALLGIALISRIPIWALGAWKDGSLFRLFAAHLFTYVIVSVASAYGLADGGPPQWQVGFQNYALPALLVFMLDVIIMLSRRNASREPAPPAWFIHSDGKQTGPLTTAAVRAALAEGSVKPSDSIWRDGFKEWVQMETVDLPDTEEKPLVVASVETKESNYLLRHWRGANSLSASYWGSGALIAILFIVPYLILMKLELADHPRMIGTAIIGLWLTLIAALLWLSIGIFRSAEQYTNEHPKQYWGDAAKVTTVIAGLAVLFVFMLQGVPQIQKFASLMSKADEPRYSLQLLRGNTELELKGPLDGGVSEAIAANLKDHPTVKTVHLNSPGGTLSEADKLTDIVLQKNLNTYVSASCSGSCVTVFAAGKTRWLSRNASLALHKPNSANATREQLDAVTAKTKTFLYSRGIAAAFVDRGLAAAPHASWHPTHAELFDSGLATSYATDAEVAVAGIPVREITDAQAALDKIPLFQALHGKHPKAHAEISAILREDYVKGRSVPEMRKRMWAVVMPIVNGSISSASDAALVPFYQVAVDEAEAFAKKDAASCQAFLKGEPGGFDMNVLPTSLQERELTSAAELVRSAGSYSGKPVGQQAATVVFAQLLPVAEAKGFSSIDLQQALQFRLDAARNCQGMILFFKSLLALKDPDRIMLLRYMSQQAPAL